MEKFSFTLEWSKLEIQKDPLERNDSASTGSILENMSCDSLKSLLQLGYTRRCSALVSQPNTKDSYQLLKKLGIEQLFRAAVKLFKKQTFTSAVLEIVTLGT